MKKEKGRKYRSEAGKNKRTLINEETEKISY